MDAVIEPALVPGIIFSDGVIREMGTSKCTLIGVFQGYNLPSFPFTVYPFWVTALITNLGADVTEINVTVRIENPQTGMVIGNSGAKLNFKTGPGRNVIFEVPIPVMKMTIPTAGTYSVVVLVNNEKLGERSLVVNNISAKEIPQ